MAMFHQSFAGRDLGPLLAPYFNRATSAQTDTGVDGVLRVVDRSPNSLVYTDDLNTGYTKRGTCVVTPNAGPMNVGTRKMSLISGVGAIGVNDWYKLLSALGTIETPVGISFRINRNGVMSGTLVLSNSQAIAYGRWDVNLALVPDGEVRITSNHVAVTVVQPFRLHTSGNSGVQLSCAAGLAPFYVGGFQHQVGVTDPNFTEYFHAGDNSRPAFDGDDGVILEGSSTNDFLRAEEFNNAAWTGVTRFLAFGSGSVANAIAAPDANATADLLVPSTANSGHYLEQTTTMIAGVRTDSFYVKAAGYSRIGFRENTFSGAYAAFLLTGAGSVLSTSAATAQIEALPNGWYRVSMRRTATAGAQLIGVYIMDDGYTSGSPHGYAYAGNGISGMYLWRAMTEPKPFATSSIATVAAAATRANASLSAIPVANLGIASQLQEYTIIMALKIPAPQGVSSVRDTTLFRLWNPIDSSQYQLRYHYNDGDFYFARFNAGAVFSDGIELNSSAAVAAGSELLVRCSVGVTNGAIICVGSETASNNSAAWKAAFSTAPTHIEFNYSGWTFNGVLKGLRLLDRAMSLEELQSLKPDIFDIPETGLLTRKPTNSLTKLLTRPMAA